MMSPLSWTRRFMCLAFLYTFLFLECHATSGITGKCDCTFDGKVYNLSTLQSSETRNPRFYRKRKDDYEVSYNPCTSFSFETEPGDCFDDVAICLSSTNRASNRNIGKQSTAECHEDEDGKYLEYYNKETQLGWKAKVYLNCNKTMKSPDSAHFEIINLSGDGVRTFRLSHKCACPDGCPFDDTNNPSKAKKIAIPFAIAAGIISIIAVPLVIWKYRRRQRNNNPPLIDDGHGDYETINNISQREGRRKDINIRQNASSPISVSSRSCSDIEELSKDKFNYMNNSGRASAPL